MPKFLENVIEGTRLLLETPIKNDGVWFLAALFVSFSILMILMVICAMKEKKSER